MRKMFLALWLLGIFMVGANAPLFDPLRADCCCPNSTYDILTRVDYVVVGTGCSSSNPVCRTEYCGCPGNSWKNTYCSNFYTYYDCDPDLVCV